MNIRKLEPGQLKKTVDEIVAYAKYYRDCGFNTMEFSCHTKGSIESLIERITHEIIESPEPVETERRQRADDLCGKYKDLLKEPIESDWSEVVEDIKAIAERWYMPEQYVHCSGFGDDIKRILQQADKTKAEPVTVKMWVNVYDEIRNSVIHFSKERSDANACNSRIACKEIEFTYVPGEGL